MATESEIKAAKTKMDNAKSTMDSLYASMQSWCTLVSGRTYTEGSNRTTCSQKWKVVCGEPIEAICCKSVNWSENTCEADKTTYNQRVSAYDNAVDAYENARDEYDTVRGEKSDTDEGNAEREASAIRTRYLVFGGIVIVLIVAAVFFIMKYKK